MDIEDIRAVMTVISFAAFLAIAAWAYGHGRNGRFSEAARLPFDEEHDDEQATSSRVGAQRANAATGKADAESAR